MQRTIKPFIINIVKWVSKSPKSSNDFMMRHFQRIRHRDICTESERFAARRLVFVSVCGLHRTWKECPSVLLYSAMCILSIKRDWIYHSFKYCRKRESNSMDKLSLFFKLENVQEFIYLLRWKDSQGLLFTSLDDYSHDDSVDSHKKLERDPLISSFWIYFSNKLCTMNDSITQKKYQPLELDTKWWCDTAIWSSRYETQSTAILCELFFVCMKFKTTQEIIYQSNPDTLLPITCFTHDIIDIYHSLSYSVKSGLYDAVVVNNGQKKSDWIFTSSYDPYDIDDDDDDK